MRAFVLLLAIGQSNSFPPRHPRPVSTSNRRFAENIMINDGVHADGNAGEKMKGGCLGDGSNWRVWAVIDELETNGLSASTPDEEFTTITSRVVCVLKQWANEFAGLQTWQSLLNKNALLHEVSRVP